MTMFLDLGRYFGELEFTAASRPNAREIIVRANILGTKTPSVRALGVILSDVLGEDPEARSHAIWQCALMRTSSRPVDMVFSIMGLFDITLEPGAFAKDDRIGATIALAQEILRKGDGASWIGASFRMPACPQLSTFPQFPRTSVAGKAEIETADGLVDAQNLIDGEYPYSVPLSMELPKGEMDDRGYFTFRRKAVPVTSAVELPTSTDQGSLVSTAMDGTTWQLHEGSDVDEQGYSRAVAIALGFFIEYYPGASPAGDKRKVKLILVKEHAPRKFHIQSFFALSLELRERVKRWQEFTFCVGGPDPLLV